MGTECCPKCGGPLVADVDWISRPCPACGAIPAKVYAAARHRPPDPPAPPASSILAVGRGPNTRREPMTWTSKAVAAIVAIVVLFVGWFQFRDIGIAGRSASRTPIFSAADAPWRCRSYLSERLHDPGSAEFVEQSTVAAADGYIVVMRVRARNAFNALRLNDYICTLTRSGGLVSIQTLP